MKCASEVSDAGQEKQLNMTFLSGSHASLRNALIRRSISFTSELIGFALT